jgi:hypothetical protein
MMTAKIDITTPQRRVEGKILGEGISALTNAFLVNRFY